jgi:hypothetical protein
MNFHQLLSKMQELDQPVSTAQTNEATIEECGDMPPAPMGMEHKDTPPPSMSVNLNAQGLDDIAELMKLMTKVNPDMINQPNSMPDNGPDKLLPPMAGPSMADLRDKMIEPEPIDADGEEDGPLDNDDDEEIGGALAGGALGAVVGGPLGALTGAAAGDSLTDPDADEVEKETWDNAPEPEIQAHKYGDDQVTPKADEPPKVNGGGNPYKQTSETVESVALQLLKDYQAFVNEGKVNELSKDTLKSYNDKATTDIAKRITGDDKDLKKIGDRQKGYERASKRGVK